MLLALWSGFWDWGAEEEYTGSSLHSYDLFLEKEKQRKIKKMQSAVVALRLEAQQAILDKADLANAKEKQNTRQLQAIVRREAEIQKELLAAIKALREFDDQIMERQNQEALLVLSLACPFLVMH